MLDVLGEDKFWKIFYLATINSRDTKGKEIINLNYSLGVFLDGKVK